MNLKSIVIAILAICFIIPAIGSVAFVENEAGATGGARSYTHTVFVEDCTATWCGYCPAASEQLVELYEQGSRDFYFVSLIGDMIQEADDRINDYSISGYPTVEFDGGYEEVVGAQSDSSTYADVLDNCGARTVPDLGIDLQVTEEGAASLGVSVAINNRDASDYSGTLKVYITEKTSRYLDADGNNYPFGFVAFAIDEPFSVSSGSDYTTTSSWDGADITDLLGNDYSDIDPDNILVMAVVFDDEGSRQIRSGVTTNKFYTAYFADACAAAEPAPASSVDAPTIKILNPTNYQKVSGTVTIEAQITSSKDLSSVDVSINGGSSMSMTNAGSTYTYDWDTSGLSEGNYKIEITAVDVFNNEATRTVTAKVESASTAPAIEITNIRHTPYDPLDTDTVRISCEVFVNEASVDSVTIAICRGETCDLPENMIDEGGGTFSFEGGPYEAGLEVSYAITARDSAGNAVSTDKYYITIFDSGSGGGGGDDDVTTDDDVTSDDDVSSDDDSGVGFNVLVIAAVGIIVFLIIIVIIVMLVTRRREEV